MFIKVCTQKTLSLNNSRVCFRLKLVCLPKNGSKVGEQTEVISTESVSAGPGVCPFDNRQLHTTTCTPAGQYVQITVIEIEIL